MIAGAKNVKKIMKYFIRDTQKKHKDFMIADQRLNEDMHFIYLKNNDFIIKIILFTKRLNLNLCIGLKSTD